MIDEKYLPQFPQYGPPLPRLLNVFWPWVKTEAPAGGGEEPSNGGETPGGRIPIDIDWRQTSLGAALVTPGSVRNPRVSIPVKPAGMACEAELWLSKDGSTKIVSSGRVAFTSTGIAQALDFAVTMPSVGGEEYQVLIDIYSGGMLLAGYVGKDTVIIPWVGEPTITW